MSSRKLHPSQSILKRIKGSGSETARNKSNSGNSRPLSAYLDSGENVSASKESLKKENDVFSYIGASLLKKFHFTSSQNDLREDSRKSKSGSGTPTNPKHPSPPSLCLPMNETSIDISSSKDPTPSALLSSPALISNTPVLIQGFHSSGSEDEEMEDEDSMSKYCPNAKDNNPRENIRALASMFSSVDSVLQRAIRSACVLDFLFSYRRDPSPFLFKLLLDDYREASRQAISSKDVLHKATQLYVVFLHSKGPLRLPISQNEESQEIFSQISPFTLPEKCHELDNVVRILIQKDLDCLNDKVITQGMYANIIPDVVLNGINSREDDLREFDRKLNTHYTTFSEQSTLPSAVGVQCQAKLWCLEEIGRYWSEKVLKISYNENDSLPPSSRNTLRPGLHNSFMSRSSENLNSMYFWQEGSSYNLRRDVSPKQVQRRSTILGKSRKTTQPQIQIRNHCFVPQSLDKPAECAVCNEIFWGYEADKCPTCQLCSMRVHSKCQTDNLKKCTKKMTSESHIPRTYSDSNNPFDLQYSSENSPSSASFSINESMRSKPDSLDKTGRYDSSYFNGDIVIPSTPLSPIRGPNLKEISGETRLSVDTSSTLNRKSTELSSQINSDDIGRYFPKEDEFFTVDESYDGALTKRQFPQSDKLSEVEMKRLHILAEYHYYIRYAIKQLKILDLFCNKLWKEQVKNDNSKLIYENLGFPNIAPLVDLYVEQEKFIRRAMTQSTYKPFGNHIMEWLRKHEIPLFRYTNSLCGCVRNASVWQELEKPQPYNQEVLKLLNEVYCQRFSMKHKVQNIYVVLVIRIPFVLNHTRDALRKMNSSEYDSWEKIHLWYHRIPKYQNNRLQPLLTAITECRFLNGISSAEKSFEAHLSFLLQFPKQMFDDFLFAWQPVKVLSVTSTMSSTSQKESNVSRNSSTNSTGGGGGPGANAGIQGSEINTDLSRSNESHHALLILYQTRLVILQRSEGSERFVLKSFKTKKTDQGITSSSILPGRGTLVSTQQHMLPVFNLDEIYCSLTVNIMYLIIVNRHDNNFLQLEFPAKDDGERWKEMLQQRVRHPHVDGGAANKSGTLNVSSSNRKGMARFSVRSFRAPSLDPRDLYQQLFTSLDLEAATGGPKENALKALLGSSFGSFLEQQQQTRPQTAPSTAPITAPNQLQHSSSQKEVASLLSPNRSSTFISQSLPHLHSSLKTERKIGFDTPDGSRELSPDVSLDNDEEENKESEVLRETEVVLSDEESDNTISPVESPRPPDSTVTTSNKTVEPVSPFQEQLLTDIRAAKKASDTLIENIDIRFQQLDSSASEIVQKIKDNAASSTRGSTSSVKPSVEEMLLCCIDRLAVSNTALFDLLKNQYFPPVSMEESTSHLDILEHSVDELRTLIKECKLMLVNDDRADVISIQSISQDNIAEEDCAIATIPLDKKDPPEETLLRLMAHHLVEVIMTGAKERIKSQIIENETSIPPEPSKPV